MPGRAGPPVEAREPEVVPAPLEVVQEQRELTQVEDRLVRDPPRPAGRPELDAESARRPLELPRLVREHPLRRLLLDEEPGVRRPVPRPEADERAPQGPSDRSRDAAGARCERHLSRRRATRRARAAREVARGPCRRGGARALEVDRRRPAEPLPRLRGVAHEVVQLGLAAEERVVDAHVLLPVEPDVRESAGGELADASDSRRSRSRSRPAPSCCSMSHIART